MTGFPQRNLLTGSQVWTGDAEQDAQASQEAFDGLSLALQQLKNRTVWGVTDGSDALEGQIGEYVESSVTGIGSWASNTPQNVTSLTLTAGDWDVEGSLAFDVAAITGTGSLTQITTTSAGFDATNQGLCETPSVPTANAAVRLTCPSKRFSVSATTTVYLVGRIIFTVGTPSASGYLRARRVR